MLRLPCSCCRYLETVSPESSRFNVPRQAICTMDVLLHQVAFEDQPMVGMHGKNRLAVP
jgi:hypothetical protein